MRNKLYIEIHVQKLKSQSIANTKSMLNIKVETSAKW